MTTFTATYSPEDNKLRLYASSRLDADTYARAKALGFRWAPKQDLFVAPAWSPDREDFLIELAGELGDEDTSLADRQAERADRFEEYRDNRQADAAGAHAAVERITSGIPLGQPILVGHHSERHARKDAERIESGMRRAVKMWETAQYWKSRAAGAIRHAKYKERPDVRARRIKGIEADRRKQARIVSESEALLHAWRDPAAVLKRKDGQAASLRELVIFLANRDGGYWEWKHTHASGYVGPLSLWEAAGGNTREEDPESLAVATPEEICAKAIRNHEGRIAWARRWLGHYDNRLTYEREMLAADGGTVADRTRPEVGGAVRCLWAPRGGWAYIVKVNRITVTVRHQWQSGNGRVFAHNEPFDKLAAVMSAAEVQEKRDTGMLVDAGPAGNSVGFYLRDAPLPERKEPEAEPVEAAAIEAMRDTLKAGIKVEAVPQLFPTPRELAARVIDLAGIEPGHRVLEPSAGTGALVGAMGGRMFGHDPERGELVAVEINAALCANLRREFPLTEIRNGDFLAMNGELGTFDRIVMNPPFGDGADIRHIVHARSLLRPGGRLVAICANGPRQQRDLSAAAELWEPLPADTFKEQGTGVHAALIVFEAEDRLL